MADSEHFPFVQQLRPEAELVEDELDTVSEDTGYGLRVTRASLARADRALRWLEKHSSARAREAE